ncbi:MAG: hypothetical protein FWG64_01475 [Firmicutes bacterium]|nr:hypothetical protein [Bacillota bacterium]
MSDPSSSPVERANKNVKKKRNHKVIEVDENRVNDNVKIILESRTDEEPSADLTVGDLHTNILREIFKSTTEIKNLAIADEELKARNREWFKKVFVSFSFALLAILIVIILVETFTDYSLPLGLLFIFITMVLSNVFGIIMLMVKYMNNSEYLKIIDTISKGLLDYLAKTSAKSDEEK